MSELGVMKFFIERTLRSGLDAIRENPDETDIFLSVYQDQSSESLSDNLVEEFRNWIQRKVQKIYHQYPLPGERALPCFVIAEMESKESPGQSFIAERITPVSYVEHLDLNGDLVQKDRVEFFGSEWDCTYEVQTWTTNPLLTPMLHSLAIFILFKGKPTMTAAGGNTISFGESANTIRDDSFPNVPFLQSLMLFVDQPFKWKKVTQNISLRKNIIFNKPVSSTPE